MTEAMPFLQKYDITFLRPPTIRQGAFLVETRLVGGAQASSIESSTAPSSGVSRSRESLAFRL